MNSSALPLLAVLAGALAGAGLFVFIAAVRGLPPKAKSQGPSALERAIKDVFSIRGGVAVIVGILTLLITRWVVAGIGMALLAYSWRSLSGAASERKAMARLEGLATWTESLRDTIAGAVGLEQAIPASTRVADGSIREPLARLVDRLHTRVPMHVALRRFVSSVREVTGVDGRVLSSEVFAPSRDGRAVPHAPASCLDELAAFGYDPSRGGWR